MRIRHMVIVLAGLALLAWSAVDSLPRLAVENSTQCLTCHVNPSGGGMRTEFGNYSVALNERTLPSNKKFFVNRYRSPRVSDNLVVGFDTRYLILDDGRIIRMQTDIFGALEPFRDMYYFARFGESGISEHYALLFMDNKNYWIKAGRFYPAFGLRNADHTSYNRERIGLGSNLYLDGLSLGGNLGPVSVTAELFNPDDRAMGHLHAYTVGYNEPFGYLLGGSVRLTEEVEGSNGIFPVAKSLFGGLSYGRLSAVSEVDLVGQSSDTLAFYAGLTGRIEYGLHLIAEYSFFDPDRNLADGADEFYRLSVEFFPIPFVQFRPSYTKYTRGFLDGEQDFFVQFYVGN